MHTFFSWWYGGNLCLTGTFGKSSVRSYIDHPFAKEHQPLRVLQSEMHSRSLCAYLKWYDVFQKELNNHRPPSNTISKRTYG